MLNESNIEITEITIPENETEEHINLFLATMGKKLAYPPTVTLETVIRSYNNSGLVIKGIHNEAYLLAKQLRWGMHRINPDGPKMPTKKNL